MIDTAAVFLSLRATKIVIEGKSYSRRRHTVELGCAAVASQA